MHENSLHEESCLVTLTFDSQHLLQGELDNSYFQKFMKRLRKSISPRKVRYYHAAEYGSTYHRPHHHALLFGYDFPDKEPGPTRRGHPTWRSQTLQQLWPSGRHEIGTVTFESAAYLARYLTRKPDMDRLVLNLTQESSATSKKNSPP